VLRNVGADGSFRVQELVKGALPGVKSARDALLGALSVDRGCTLKSNHVLHNVGKGGF